jgi:DNA-directed RNA polymerase subunit M/transcription elongation factor TFIIS
VSDFYTDKNWRDRYGRHYEPAVQVVLSCDGDRISEDEVEFINIEEDIQGRDRLTFKCPRCHENHTSYRLG